MKQMMKRAGSIGLAAMLSLSPVLPAFAADYSAGSTLSDKGGTVSLPPRQWKFENGGWYLEQEGALLHGWTMHFGLWYYLSPETGKMVTGWKQIGDKWYYLDPTSGEMRTGWVQDNGKWYYLLPESGAMLSGKQRIGAKTYYLNPGSGSMHTGWKQLNNQWYYFDPSGGQMKKGWVLSGSVWYYLKSNGTMACSTWIQDHDKKTEYYVDASGAMTRERSIQTQKPSTPKPDPKPEDQPTKPEQPSRPKPDQPEQKPDDKTDPGENLPAPDDDQKPVESNDLYSYHTYVLNQDVYSSTTVPVYVQITDRKGNLLDWTKQSGEYPRVFVDASDQTGDPVPFMMVSPFGMNFEVFEEYNGTFSSISKVKGGYLTFLCFDDPGTYTIRVTAYNDEQDNGKEYEIPIDVLDFEAAENAWMDEVIARNTDSSMDPFEKMEKISAALLDEFKYLKNGPDRRLARYIQDEGVPYFILKEWDSYVSPNKLCKFAERVGGFDDIHDCYPDYPIGSAEWQETHFLCRLTIGNTVRYVQACPFAETNYLDHFEQYDFGNTAQMRQLS